MQGEQKFEGKTLSVAIAKFIGLARLKRLDIFELEAQTFVLQSARRFVALKGVCLLCMTEEVEHDDDRMRIVYIVSFTIRSRAHGFLLIHRLLF